MTLILLHHLGEFMYNFGKGSKIWKMSNKTFITIRVYGIWINEKAEILLTDEYIQGMYITKFPGGGLEPGEGIADCLKREWKEETGGGIEIKELLYINDFLQISVFNPDAQVISVYYLVEPKTPIQVKLRTKIFDFDELYEGAQVFRLVPIKNLRSSDLSLPIDQKIVDVITRIKILQKPDLDI